MHRSDAVPVAVIGLGHFGRFHAQKWRVTEGARLAALVDHDVKRAAALADELGPGIAAFDDPRALRGVVRAASVAVPTRGHFEVASLLISQGIHLLLEKPIAADLDEADRLIAAAARANLLLQIGHQERFFFHRVPGIDGLEAPLNVTAERFGVPSGRKMDCSVVLDLMIHDIDLVLSRIGADLVGVSAQGDMTDSGFVEKATAELVFADGSKARLTADRQAAQRRRTMTLSGRSRDVTVDFLARRAHDGANDLMLAAVPPALEGDTLLAQSTAFIAALRGQPMRGADGTAGRRALDAALAIEARLSS